MNAPCSREFQILKTRYAETKDTDIPKIRASLQSVLKTIHDEFHISPLDFLSDDVRATGNIGTKNAQEKFTYLTTSPVVTLRELTNALVNVLRFSRTFSDAMFRRITTSDSRNNFVQTRKRNVRRMLNMNNSNNGRNLMAEDKALWKKQLVLNKLYAYKRFALANVPRNLPHNQLASCTLQTSQLIEPLSTREQQFYEEQGVDPEHLPVVMGACKYAQELAKNRRSRKRKQRGTCAIAGLSGHTLMLVDLFRLLQRSPNDIENLVTALEYSFVPIHHSLSEIQNAKNAVYMG
jgi:hypothetical protein